MHELLFLAHRIPYPPNKGDKIRSWNELLHLTSRYRVHLGCFVDDEEDWQYVPFLRALCGETLFAPLRRTKALARCVPGLINGTPLTLRYYRDPDMSRWVDDIIARRRLERVFVFSSAMAQYVRADGPRLRRVIDFVDVDSDKWRQYAERKSWPLSRIYRRESLALLAVERAVAAGFDASLFVSRHEADLFRSLSPETADKVRHVNNGVDIRFFTPEGSYDDPYVGTGPVVAFTGAMNYWANVDAVEWFVHNVFRAVRARFPKVRFFIVGARPSPAVLRLAQEPGVVVTGRVPDIRPYLAFATVVVAPLRVARGTQNKVLEAMAMAKPVVATPQALEGLGAAPGREILVAEGADDFATAVAGLLEASDDGRAAMGRPARAHVVAHHDWDSELSCLEDVLK